MNGVLLRWLVLSLLACLPWGQGMASTEPESYVQGIYIRSVGRYYPLQILKQSPYFSSCANRNAIDETGRSEQDEYIALIGGELWTAAYMKLWVPEGRVPTAAEMQAFTFQGKVPCLLAGVKVIEIIKILNDSRMYSRDENGRWKVEPRAPIEIAQFFGRVLIDRTLAKGFGKRLREDSVVNVKCTVYTISSTQEICVAEKDTLRRHGVYMIDYLPLRVTSRDTGRADNSWWVVTYIDFKARIPLSVLFPPEQVRNTPPIGTKEAQEKPGRRGARIPSPAEENDG